MLIISLTIFLYKKFFSAKKHPNLLNKTGFKLDYFKF